MKSTRMIKICHRINTVEQLKATDPCYGVEMDLHAYGERLVVHHDAFKNAIDFEDWLSAFQHAFVVLNIKEEGIETRVLEIMLQHRHHNFFMLDLSFPALIKMVHCGEQRVAVRVSEYEPVDAALNLSDKVKWVWIDLFQDKIPLNPQQYLALKKTGMKLCLVSPELHGRDKALIQTLRADLHQQGFLMDAVCTKYPELW